MMAAARAAALGANTILLEKQKKVGRKLAITGKGRCNITSMASSDSFIQGYAGNGKFLYSSLRQFSNVDLVRLLNGLGVQTKVERGQRVFPVSDNAEEVVQALSDYVRSQGVKVLTDARVDTISRQSDFFIVGTAAEAFRAEALIIATGGMSYPGTGSTGDGYAWLKQLGHSVTPLRPGLVPLVTEEKWVRDLSGLTLKNIRATVYDAQYQREISSQFGELLFTHFGVSGPIVLTMSRAVGEYLSAHAGTARMDIDLKPALNVEKLTVRVQRELDRFSRKHLKNMLAVLLPHRLIPIITVNSGLAADKLCADINREERSRLVACMKKLSLIITETRSLAEAIVTVGGIKVVEVNPKTMESKICPGLFIAGEILDIDGYTGGYNLQAAFSTGWVAGQNAAH